MIQNISPEAKAVPSPPSHVAPMSTILPSSSASYITPSKNKLLESAELASCGSSDPNFSLLHSTSSPSSSITCPTASSLFPPVSDVIKMIEVDKPGKGFDRLLYAMLEAGMVTSEQILLVPEDVLSVIGVMGQARARILRNYAKHVVLPMLGLAGNYEEQEIALDEKIDERKIDVLAGTGYTDICKEFLELGDSDDDQDEEAEEEAEEEEESVEQDELEGDEEETSDSW